MEIQILKDLFLSKLPPVTLAALSLFFGERFINSNNSKLCILGFILITTGIVIIIIFFIFWLFGAYYDKTIKDKDEQIKLNNDTHKITNQELIKVNTALRKSVEDLGKKQKDNLNTINKYISDYLPLSESETKTEI